MRSAWSRSSPVVAIAPRFGGLLVAGWLAGIIVSLLLVGGYGDIALRDVGLLLGALTLFGLAGTQSADPDDGGLAEPVTRGGARQADGGLAA